MLRRECTDSNLVDDSRSYPAPLALFCLNGARLMISIPELFTPRRRQRRGQRRGAQVPLPPGGPGRWLQANFTRTNHSLLISHTARVLAGASGAANGLVHKFRSRLVDLGARASKERNAEIQAMSAVMVPGHLDTNAFAKMVRANRQNIR